MHDGYFLSPADSLFRAQIAGHSVKLILGKHQIQVLLVLELIIKADPPPFSDFEPGFPKWRACVCTGTVLPPPLQDNQYYRVKFAPISLMTTIAFLQYFIKESQLQDTE